MIELYQFSYSPYCIVQQRILEYAGARFKVIDIPNGDRSLIWRITRQRYYCVPVIRDGRRVVFEIDEDSQVIAKYLDFKLDLGLFPRAWEGVQSLLWVYFEHDIEEPCFKLNDVYWREHTKGREEQLRFVRHKERRFGRGCLDRWREEQDQLLARLETLLLPCETMLFEKPFLLGDRPLFVDFDLYGMLGNFLYSGHYEIPRAHARLREWYRRVSRVKHSPTDFD